MAEPQTNQPTESGQEAAETPAAASNDAGAAGDSARAEELLAAAEQAASESDPVDAREQPLTPGALGERSVGSSRSDRAAQFEMPAFGGTRSGQGLEGIDLLSDVNLNVKIELGRTRMLVEDVLRLAEDSVVELDKLAGDPVDVYVNDRPIARGEVLVLNDNFCIRINEILSPATLDDVRRATP